MNNKMKILNEIKKSVPNFRPATRDEYRMTCPFCGDPSNPEDMHLYIKCTPDPTEPMPWLCFKCNQHGIVNSWFLEQLGVDDETCNLLDTQHVNRFSLGYMKTKPIKLMTGNPVPDSYQIKYIESRLGPGLTMEDFDKFKIVWDMSCIYPYITDDRIKNTMPSNANSITFLSEDKTMLLSRSFYPDGGWRKIKFITSDTKSFYTISTAVDLFSKDNIIVNIGEGVFDILSVYKNFNEPNSVYIAALGSDYVSAIEFIIAKGFVGRNIEIRVYMDSDQNEKQVISKLKRFKWLFGSIRVLTNAIGKDVGVTVDKIRLNEKRV